MATSFSEPKLKAFPLRPRSAVVAGLMQTCLFILAANWCLQGMRGMDRKELVFRLVLELALAAGAAALLAPPLGWPALPLSLILAHSFSFTLNGQVWVCARYCRRYRRDPAALGAFLHGLAVELRDLPWLREALYIGSIGRTGAVHGDRSDLDLRLLFPPGGLAWLRVNLLLLRLRARAFVQRIPLDLYAYEQPERLRRFDQRERLMVLLDRDGRLAALYPAPRRPLAVIETRRTCWAYSPGGHLTELERATAGIAFSDRFDVTFAGGRPPTEPPRRTYLVCHPRRSVGRTLRNLARSLVIVLRERPRLVISTGADVAVPICILARLLGARLVFIETAGELEPTLAGRLVYPFASLFIVQWPEKLAAFPRAVLASGPLL